MTPIDLADGRELDIQVTGPQDGIPLVMHHGTPGSIVCFRVVEEAVHRRGLRLVTYSRAGYGTSTRKPGRTVADIAADVTAVLDHIGAERCVTLGWSGGGPHALASAALLPGRVVAATTIASVGPYGIDDLDFLAGMGQGNIEEFGAALAGEPKLAAALDEAAVELRGAGPDEVVASMSTLLPDEDRAVVVGEVGEELAAQITEGVRLGAGGWIDDDLAFVNHWGFSVDDITVPVFVWQGDRDLMVPFAHGRWLADRIPGAVAHLLPGEGHISVFINRVDEILGELAAALS
ncbi:alpha/beta hydrolase [Actinospica sp.]|uniref:alpha/beta fold hydrolase n=1 Tax=Actinospica sp. TaxID=1872142 RepID=UPI002BC20648|nr:alpha/beta hydrolase [Actinospica sp.]HWG28653.1 alpha/beta hydrolase [Actinospica sp.]